MTKSISFSFSIPENDFIDLRSSQNTVIISNWVAAHSRNDKDTGVLIQTAFKIDDKQYYLVELDQQNFSNLEKRHTWAWEQPNPEKEHCLRLNDLFLGFPNQWFDSKNQAAEKAGEQLF